MSNIFRSAAGIFTPEELLELHDRVEAGNVPEETLDEKLDRALVHAQLSRSAADQSPQANSVHSRPRPIDVLNDNDPATFRVGAALSPSVSDC